MGQAVQQGLMTEQLGRFTLDQAIRTNQYVLPSTGAVVVPIWDRIDWSGIIGVSLCFGVAMILPWLFYGTGLYVAKGFARNRTS